jgi:hypothetical protein
MRAVGDLPRQGWHQRAGEIANADSGRDVCPRKRNGLRTTAKKSKQTAFRRTHICGVNGARFEVRPHYRAHHPLKSLTPGLHRYKRTANGLQDYAHGFRERPALPKDELSKAVKQQGRKSRKRPWKESKMTAEGGAKPLK